MIHVQFQVVVTNYVRTLKLVVVAYLVGMSVVQETVSESHDHNLMPPTNFLYGLQHLGVFRFRPDSVQMRIRPKPIYFFSRMRGSSLYGILRLNKLSSVDSEATAAASTDLH